MRRITTILMIHASLFAASCSSSKPAVPPVGDEITQISLIHALMIGRYDGVMPIGEMLKYGDFGVGTLDHLDGEMLVLDGKVFQVDGEGNVHAVPDDRSTPFAAITHFDTDGEFECPKVESLTDLDHYLDKALPQNNNFLAIRVHGKFDAITLRSVGRQSPPYRPLAEVAKSQSVWTHENVTGTFVGIRSPSWVGGLGVPGYHWHFIADDRNVGGHVLDCKIREGHIRHDVCSNWNIKLESSVDFNKANLTGDLRKEINEVETSRGHSNK